MIRSLIPRCVILDEARNARRSNLGKTKKYESAKPNNLLEMVRSIALQTKSMLFATATPVQLDPIEVYDLLNALNLGNNTVLGSIWSWWLNRPREGFALVSGEDTPPEVLEDRWEWICDPFPLAGEGHDCKQIRDRVGPPKSAERYGPEVLQLMRPADQDSIRRIAGDFFADHNPYIRHIVRRIREFLENEIDPSSGEPYLPKVEVRLFGEEKNESILLSSTLRDAYEAAEEVCEEAGKRPGFNSGFLQTVKASSRRLTARSSRAVSAKVDFTW